MSPSLGAIAIFACCGMVGQPIEATSLPIKVADTGSLAKSLATAMLVNDRSVRTMRWRQVALLGPDGDHPGRFESRHVLDERGRWIGEFRHEFAEAGPDGGAQQRVVIEGRYVFDGHELYGLDPMLKSGTIRGYSGERVTEAGIDRWMGRHLHLADQSLAEMLVAAPDLALGGYSERGLPIITATVDMTPLLAFVEVEIDPEHGFAPRTILIRDRAMRTPYYRYTTTEFVNVAGAWLPAKGRLETRQADATAEQGMRLDAALRARGLSKTSDHRNAEVQEAFAEALREAFGVPEHPSVEMAPPIEVEVVYEQINALVDESEFRVELPEAYLVYDSLRDLVKRAGSSRWESNRPIHEAN